MYKSTTATPTISLRGRIGHSYQFEIYPWDTSFKPLGAVYVPMRLENSGTYTILYVGQTSDLSERFDEHHKKWCFNQYAKSHIAVLLQSSEAKRLAIEADLVASYNPVCNG